MCGLEHWMAWVGNQCELGQFDLFVPEVEFYQCVHVVKPDMKTRYMPDSTGVDPCQASYVRPA